MSKGIINSNGKVKSNLHSETRVGKEVYGSGIDEQGSAQSLLRAAVFGQGRHDEALRGANSLWTFGLL